MIRYFLLVLVILVLFGSADASQNNSLYQSRALEKARLAGSGGDRNLSSVKGIKIDRHRGSGRTGVPVLRASLTAVEEPAPKRIHVHDLISIIIHEVSSNESKAETSTERSTSADFKLDDWIRMSGLQFKPERSGRVTPKVKGSASRSFEGEGDISREDSLSARIQAEVVDVFPNGNVRIQAIHKITTDDETMTMTLTGICRNKDVGVDNTIISSKIYNLEVKKTHTGSARDATKRSWLQRLVDFLNVF